jgi:4-hydroxy-tetrahydrodipicolinate synthase
MDALENRSLYGNWVPLLLPIQADDSIDFDRLKETLDLLVSCEVNGIYSNGTAGEFYAQTEAEFDRVQLLLAERCNAAEMPFQIGCSHPVGHVSLERIKRCLALRPSAIQVILPDWSPPSRKETMSFLRRMVEVAYPIGIVLYNPPHAKYVLTPDDYRFLRHCGVFLVGCKVADGNASWYAVMRDADPELSIFVPGHHLATGIASGAKGSYSNVACLNPRVAQAWYETMLTDLPSALVTEGKICAFIADVIMPYITKERFCDAAVDKFLAEVGGWAPTGTRVRWPYESIPADEALRARKIARAQLPEFFEKSIHV